MENINWTIVPKAIFSSPCYQATVKNFLGYAHELNRVYPACMNSLDLLSVRLSGVGMNIRLDPSQAAGTFCEIRKSQEALHLPVSQTTVGLII